MNAQRSSLRSFALSLPAIIAIAPFLGACFYIFRFSVSGESGVISGYSLQAYFDLAEPFFLRSVWVTVKLAALSTLVVIVLAVPIALVIASVRTALVRRLLTVTILLPMILNLLIQSYGWIILLGPSGVLNTTLRETGLISRPILLLFNETGVLLGLIQTAIPLAVFPILSATRVISREYLEAASSLGAGNWRVFYDVILPLLKPGLVSAASIVFAYNASAFAVPLLLGGRRVQMLGVAIRDMISPLFNWSGAAAAGMVLIVITTGVLLLAAALINRSARTLKANEVPGPLQSGGGA
ncbi:ABC transporter permease [Denitrobaculum tricleocarpae]|uniref:ABC transporter permease n=1 Tax=Denitrobaculum tricleocarpae TaxID=2591009 RepID=A0A545TMM4_9PROT|nr:ABC transporter permease [Denitrobaculum tricleocarpae]TQV78401.1 ABC transporter permease [Denitrobaculum tricleocarpae]